MSQSRIPEPDILFESGAVLVVNKPGGLLTQAPPGIDSLELRTKRWLIDRDNKPGKAYVGVPHRLDRPVSGVMVLVKNVRAARRISEQFRNRTVVKKYWAVVEGELTHEAGTWHDSMRKVPDEARSEIVDPNAGDAKQAVLRYRVMAKTPLISLLEIQLETGRTHQIRLQCSSRGFPIVGDWLYGATTPFGPTTHDVRKRWIALHSRQIVFEHPMKKTKVEQIAPFADPWHVFSEFKHLWVD